jgi:hypothetical protein
VVRENEDVFFPVSERGQEHDLEGQAVQEVALETSLRGLSERSTLVAPMIRTSTWIGLVLPTRSNAPYSTTRRIFSWVSMGMREISSRKRVPLSAASKRPLRRPRAPVNAPSS